MAWYSGITGTIGKIGNYITGGAKTISSDAGNAIKSTTKAVSNGIQNTVYNIFESIISGLLNAIDSLIMAMVNIIIGTVLDLEIWATQGSLKLGIFGLPLLAGLTVIIIGTTYAIYSGGKDVL